MSIKKLQNDYTTPEQSKRLLELGVPADTANIHYHQECVRMEYEKEEFEYFIRHGKPDTNKYSTDIPCWSVGRLIEINNICYTSLVEQEYYIKMKDCNIDYMINLFELAINIMDFSKLED